MPRDPRESRGPRRRCVTYFLKMSLNRRLVRTSLTRGLKCNFFPFIPKTLSVAKMVRLSLVVLLFTELMTVLHSRKC